MAPQYKLTYFDVRALAEPIRLLFAFQGIEYTDERIQRENWPALKSSKPWGNMPVLEEDGQIFAQSNTILRYLGKKYGLAGSNDVEFARCDEYLEAMADLRQPTFQAVRESDASKKEEKVNKLLNESFPFYFGRWNGILEKNGTGYLVGNKLSIADLTIANYIQIFMEVFPQILDNFDALKKHQLVVFNAKGIKEWVEQRRPKTQW